MPMPQAIKSRTKKGCHSGSKKETEKKVHFATLMDLCHLKNAELGPKLPKYTGRVVLRNDIVKDKTTLELIY